MARRVMSELGRWWIKMPLPERVKACKAAGLEGRVAARRFSLLTDAEKEALEWQREQ